MITPLTYPEQCPMPGAPVASYLTQYGVCVKCRLVRHQIRLQWIAHLVQNELSVVTLHDLDKLDDVVIRMDNPKVEANRLQNHFLV